MKIRNWWNSLHWKTQTVIEGTVFWTLVLLAVAFIGWLDARWPQ